MSDIEIMLSGLPYDPTMPGLVEQQTAALERLFEGVGRSGRAEQRLLLAEARATLERQTGTARALLGVMEQMQMS